MQRSQGHDNKIAKQGHNNEMQRTQGKGNIQSSPQYFMHNSPQSKQMGNNLCHVFFFLYIHVGIGDNCKKNMKITTNYTIVVNCHYNLIPHLVVKDDAVSNLNHNFQIPFR